MIRSGNNLVHVYHLFHDLRYEDNNYLLHGALLNALLWDQSHNFIDLLNALAVCSTIRSGAVLEGSL